MNKERKDEQWKKLLLDDDDYINTHNIQDDSSSSEDDESEIDACSFINRTYTSCTSCHICLADFEEVEKLVLLPRCGHLFHYDCILPWLTEHKSHCPLCKTEVIQYHENDTASMAVLP